MIGSVGSYTEDGFTDPGEPAIEAWASWVNAHGGVNGHPVKLIVEDNKGDQAQAVSMVKQLVQQDHVIAFVSNQDGSLNAGYASYLDQQKIPVLGGSVFTLQPWVSDPMFYPEGLTAHPGHDLARAKRQGRSASPRSVRWRARRPRSAPPPTSWRRRYSARPASTTSTAGLSARPRPTTPRAASPPSRRGRRRSSCSFPPLPRGRSSRATASARATPPPTSSPARRSAPATWPRPRSTTRSPARRRCPGSQPPRRSATSTRP